MTGVPKAVKISHATFDVIADPSECEVVGSNGHCHGDRRRIAYRDDLPVDKVREVLLHETLHAAFAVCGRADLFKDDDAEEAVVHALTGPLLDLLRRNARLVEFWRA